MSISARGNLYALAALRDRRATLAAEIVDLERQLRARRDSLIHVDATLRLLDPSIETSAIKPKRIVKRIKLFRQGQLGRLILDAIRTAGGQPIATYDIVSSIIAAGGHGEEARRTVAPRVRGNLAYLRRRRMVEKIEDGRVALWRLTDRSIP